MPRIVRQLQCMAAALLLAACSAVPPQAYVPPPQPLKRVLVVTPVRFPPLQVGRAGDVRLLLHAHPQLSARLDRMVRTAGEHYERDLVHRIVENFAAAGIAAEVVPDGDRNPRTGLLDDYRAISRRSKGADAVLDIAVLEAGYGASDPVIDSDFRPVLQLRARLVSARTLKTLYAGEVAFGDAATFRRHGQDVRPPREYYFPGISAVLANPDKAAAGLRAAATEAADLLTARFIQP